MFKIFRLLNGADWFQIIGALFICFGCFLFTPTVGFIITGIFLLLFGIALGRGRMIDA